MNLDTAFALRQFKRIDSDEWVAAYDCEIIDAVLADYRSRIAELERQNRMLMQRDWLFAEAFAEVKAIADGDKEQTLQQVVEGLIEELPPVVKST